VSGAEDRTEFRRRFGLDVPAHWPDEAVALVLRRPGVLMAAAEYCQRARHTESFEDLRTSVEGLLHTVHKMQSNITEIRGILDIAGSD